MRRIRNILAGIVALGLVGAVAAAGEKPLPRSAASTIDGLFSEISGHTRPGCAVGVARHGEPIFARGYGLANLETGTPIGPDTVFDIGSVSKQLTAGAIVLLAQEGKVALDENVRSYIPEVPDYGTPITVRQLLHHRGGLRDYTTLLSLAGRDDADMTTREEAIAMVARQRGVDFPAGERYEYSNTGYFLLGEIVGRASGQSLATFERERFFAPLGMRASHVHDDHALVVPHRAQAYSARKEGGYAIEMSDWEQVGDGSVMTTVGDLARWADALETGRVGGAAFVETMAGAGMPADEGASYGFGQFVTTWRGRPAYRHTGSWGGYRAYLMRLPTEHLSVAILCNTDDAGDRPKMGSAIAAAALGEAPDPVAAPAPPVETAKATDNTIEAPWPPRLAPLTGRFWSDELGSAVELGASSGTLAWIGRDGVSYLLAPRKPAAAGEQDFETEWAGKLRFTPLPNGEVDGFLLDSDPSRGIAFRRIDDPHATLRIVNAKLVDGSGAPARTASVRIAGDRITEVGDLAALPGETVFDAQGLVLAPGFIDTHSHAGGDLERLPEALGAVSQGITTIVSGQDGDSNYPLGDFFAGLEKHPAAINVASYTGHGTLREKVMGEDFRRPATPAETAAMAKLLESDMAAGSLGLATGLEYDPGIYSKTAELVALAKVAARSGGRYISHVRSEDRWFWEAIEEILTIGREAKLPVQISHIKLAMRSLWNQAPRLLERLDAARAQGIAVTADVYPYLYWHSTLTVLFPKRDFENLDEARNVLAEIAPSEGLLLGGYKPNPAYAGRTVADIAKERGEAPEVTLVALIRDAEAMRKQGAEDVENVIGTSMVEGDLEKLMAWPETNFCTDGELDGSHPRGFGSFPRVLGRYVRDKPVLSLEEAVRKMTSLAADHMGLRDRGRIAPGAYADLVLFDPATVLDRATTSEPHLLSTGIERVWVNGKVVYSKGSATGLKPGQVLRRAAG